MDSKKRISYYLQTLPISAKNYIICNLVLTYLNCKYYIINIYVLNFQYPIDEASILNLDLRPKDPHHFKNLSIFPSKEDLLQKNNILIKPNITNGAYSSVEQYLDVQFKLLREDCFGPLRDGICG